MKANCSILGQLWGLSLVFRCFAFLHYFGRPFGGLSAVNSTATLEHGQFGTGNRVMT